MAGLQSRQGLSERIREALCDEEDVLFVYLYGSRAADPEIPGSDIDVAVYLRPSEMQEYVQRDKELTALLVSRLHTHEVDLRIMNAAPFLLRYRILKEGTLIFSRDEGQRAQFEEEVMMRFFDLRPYLEEYEKMRDLRIRGRL